MNNAAVVADQDAIVTLFSVFIQKISHLFDNEQSLYQAWAKFKNEKINQSEQNNPNNGNTIGKRLNSSPDAQPKKSKTYIDSIGTIQQPKQQSLSQLQSGSKSQIDLQMPSKEKQNNDNKQFQKSFTIMRIIDCAKKYIPSSQSFPSLQQQLYVFQYVVDFQPYIASQMNANLNLQYSLTNANANANLNSAHIYFQFLSCVTVANIRFALNEVYLDLDNNITNNQMDIFSFLDFEANYAIPNLFSRIQNPSQPDLTSSFITNASKLQSIVQSKKRDIQKLQKSLMFLISHDNNFLHSLMSLMQNKIIKYLDKMLQQQSQQQLTFMVNLQDVYQLRNDIVQGSMLDLRTIPSLLIQVSAETIGRDIEMHLLSESNVQAQIFVSASANQKANLNINLFKQNVNLTNNNNNNNNITHMRSMSQAQQNFAFGNNLQQQQIQQQQIKQQQTQQQQTQQLSINQNSQKIHLFTDLSATFCSMMVYIADVQQFESIDDNLIDELGLKKQLTTNLHDHSAVQSIKSKETIQMTNSIKEFRTDPQNFQISSNLRENTSLLLSKTQDLLQKFRADTKRLNELAHFSQSNTPVKTESKLEHDQQNYLFKPQTQQIQFQNRPQFINMQNVDSRGSYSDAQYKMNSNINQLTIAPQLQQQQYIVPQYQKPNRTTLQSNNYLVSKQFSHHY